LKSKYETSDELVVKLMVQLQEKNDFFNVLETSLNEVAEEKSLLVKKLTDNKKQIRTLIKKISQCEYEKHVLQIDFVEYKKTTKDRILFIEIFMLVAYIAINFKNIVYS
jgi:D-ribose pyranose/furanose isomerase RbsD